MDDLSKILKKLRGDTPLREIADRAEISHTYLGQLEDGIDKRTGKIIKPSVEVIKKLSKAYNYSYEKLLEAAGYIAKPQQKSPKEILHFLQESEVMFDGVPISEEDKEKVRKALELVFWDIQKEKDSTHQTRQK